MTNFVMVVNGVTTEELEKLLAIQTQSQDKLRWVPQGGGSNDVSSGALTMKPAQVSGKPAAVYNNVRIEWNADANEHAAKLFAVFTAKSQQAAQAG